MGLVKITDSLHEHLRTASGAFSRSINSQAEHWMRVGMLAELYPDLNYAELSRLLLEAEHNQGGLQDLVARLDAQPLARKSEKARAA